MRQPKGAKDYQTNEHNRWVPVPHDPEFWNGDGWTDSVHEAQFFLEKNHAEEDGYLDWKDQGGVVAKCRMKIDLDD